MTKIWQDSTAVTAKAFPKLEVETLLMALDGKVEPVEWRRTHPQRSSRLYFGEDVLDTLPPGFRRKPESRGFAGLRLTQERRNSRPGLIA
jgi:hypothetical protein